VGLGELAETVDVRVPLGKTMGGTLEEAAVPDSGIPVELLRWVEVGLLFEGDVEGI